MDKYFGGKPNGSILKVIAENNVTFYLVVARYGEKFVEFFFVHHFNNDDELTRKEAQKFLYNKSYLHKQTKNLLKYTDETKNYIEIILSRESGIFCVTDSQYYDKIQKYYMTYMCADHGDYVMGQYKKKKVPSDVVAVSLRCFINRRSQPCLD